MTKTEAMRVGQDMVTKLGPEWSVRVWENLDWHVEVLKGVASVRPKFDGGYLAEVRLEHAIYTDVATGIGIQFFGEDSHPKAALRKAEARARTSIERTRNLLNHLENELGKL